MKLLNELEKMIKCEACRVILSLFRNEFNKFNNTGARMLDSIYYMTLNYFKSRLCVKSAKILPYICDVITDVISYRLLPNL